MVATPNAVNNFLKKVEEWEKEEKELEEKHYKDMERYVKSLTKKELQEKLLEALLELEERNKRYY